MSEWYRQVPINSSWDTCEAERFLRKSLSSMASLIRVLVWKSFSTWKPCIPDLTPPGHGSPCRCWCCCWLTRSVQTLPASCWEPPGPPHCGCPEARGSGHCFLLFYLERNQKSRKRKQINNLVSDPISWSEPNPFFSREIKLLACCNTLWNIKMGLKTSQTTCENTCSADI